MELEGRPPGRSGWSAFAVLACAYLVVMFQRFAPSAIADDLARDLVVSNTALGALGAAYYYPYAALQIPCGGVSDAVGPRRVLAWSLIAQSAGGIWFAQARSLGAAFSGRLLVGFGVSFVYVSALKVIREAFPRHQFPVFVGLLQAAGNMGAVVASVPLVAAAREVGWRGAFSGVAWLTLGLIPVMLRAINDPAGPREKHLWRTTSDGLRQFARNRFLIAICFWMCCFSGTKLAFQGLWAGRYLIQAGGLDAREVGVVLLLFGLGGVAGSPVFGWIAYRLRANEGTIVGGSLLVSLTWVALSVAGRPITSRWFFFFMGLVSGVFTIAFACARDRMPGELFATTVGIVNASSFVGTLVFMQLSGSVVDAVLARSGTDWAAAFRWVFGLSAASMLLASAGLLAISGLGFGRPCGRASTRGQG